MAEHRLIDANILLDKCESLYMRGHILFHGVTACTIENAPTIDPEALPIVRQLRADLSRVTAERDAAVRDLYIAKDCNTCALQYTDDCLLEECMDSCDCFAYGDVPYKWRVLKGKEL